MEQTKSFEISKRTFWEAYKLVRRNKGAAGVDGMTLEKLAAKEKDLLYKLWNRISSGSYMPNAVFRVEIPKKNGGTRPLGIPTVLDRIAQMTARLYLELILEKQFHPDSYGYRPNKSAHQALKITRQRCWRYDWVIDLDIKGFFDTINHDLLLKAVAHHKPPAWVQLYVERWLKTLAKSADGEVIERTEGTPQGGVISPILANLFLHYAFDKWMVRNNPDNPFARYADDIVIHCHSKGEAEKLLEEIKSRLSECKITVHPDKTVIVYCKNDNRKGDYSLTDFEFLGFTFRPRHAKNKNGQYFVSFSPAISKKAVASIKKTIRELKIHTWTGQSLDIVAEKLNPKIRGWQTYYGHFRRSALSGIFDMLGKCLVKWAKNRFRKLKGSWYKAQMLMDKIAMKMPYLLLTGVFVLEAMVEYEEPYESRDSRKVP